MGFMCIEISQMQRLMIFLGHPAYGLSVVLFCLLLSSGLGSFSTRAVADCNLQRSALIRFSSLLILLVVFGMLTPYLLTTYRGSITILRILIAAAILIPLGFFMGMAFPLGMRFAFVKDASLTPWFWAVNGATSVCASVFASIISLSFGISASFWVGALCYGATFMAYKHMRFK
jgi:predicted membrane-bound spermidine synthase